MITITDGTTTVELPDSVEWTDEFSWSPIEQDVKRPVGGALIINEAAVLGGRPITLQSGDSVWVERSKIKQLHTWASTAGVDLTVTFADAQSFDVVWRLEDGAMEARPVWRKNTGTYTDADVYNLTLRFMEK